MAGVFFGQFYDMMPGTGWPRIYMAGFLTCVGHFLPFFVRKQPFFWGLTILGWDWQNFY